MTRRIYAQSDALGNRVGLHYSRFRPKRKTPSLANQILSRLKNLKIRVFDRESAKTGYLWVHPGRGKIMPIARHALHENGRMAIEGITLSRLPDFRHWGAHRF